MNSLLFIIIYVSIIVIGIFIGYQLTKFINKKLYNYNDIVLLSIKWITYFVIMCLLEILIIYIDGMNDYTFVLTFMDFANEYIAPLIVILVLLLFWGSIIVGIIKFYIKIIKMIIDIIKEE